MTPYTTRPLGAIGLAALFAAGTAYVLFEDVIRHHAPITTAHVLTALALIGTIAAGHYVLPEAKAGRLLQAAGLAVLFLVGTTYIVTMSGARNAEAAAAKTAQVRDVNGERARIERLRTEAEQMRDASRRALAQAKCRLDGGGRNIDSRGICQRTQATLDVYTGAVKGHTADLKATGPALDENAGYAHAGRVLAAATGGHADPAAIAVMLALVMPYLAVLITELGTLLFAHMALRPAPGSQLPAAQAPGASDSLAERLAAFERSGTRLVQDVQVETPDNDPTPPRGPRRRTREAHAENRAKVMAFRQAYVAKHGVEPAARLVEEMTGVPRMSAWRYLAGVSGARRAA